VVGTIAMSNAAAAIHAKVASSPTLAHALATFNASAAHNPALAQLVGAVSSGPLGANSVPDPPNPLKAVAFDALGHANAIGYVVCGIAGLATALLVVFGISGDAHKAVISEESLEN
jgi:hypothetical protein